MIRKYKAPGDENIIMPKMLSQEFPVKAMCKGVFGCPISHHKFDGKILLDRVSERVAVSNLACHQNFKDDVMMNQAIKNGEWRDIFDTHSPILVLEIIVEVATFYKMEDVVMDRIELKFDTFIGNAGNSKVAKLDYDDNIFDMKFRTNKDKNIPEMPLSINDINLRVRYQIGDKVEKIDHVIAHICSLI